LWQQYIGASLEAEGGVDMPTSQIQLNRRNRAAGANFSAADREAPGPHRTTPDAATGAPTAATTPWQNILIWVGCVESALRGCELAIELRRYSGAAITLGVPGGSNMRALGRLAAELTHAGVDVRVKVLPDRSLLSLLDAVHAGGHDLVIHADRDDAMAPEAELLSRHCPCPVWTIRLTPSPREATTSAKRLGVVPTRPYLAAAASP
jgi:hypothetical protein